MKMPALFRKIFSKKVKAQPPAPPAPAPKLVVAPMTQEELQAYIAFTVVAVVGVAIATVMGGSASSLRDSSMKLLASATNEASAKIEAFKKSSQ